MSRRFNAFKDLLKDTAYLAQVNSAPEVQLKFLKTLEDEQFTAHEILELIEIPQDRKIRSLLIVHLLSQAEYLKNLEGESILKKLTEPASPSRLNAWTHQLDVNILSADMIKKLAPEAAASLLCSIPHFHQFSEQQVFALLRQYLNPNLIRYWIKNFASMPNGYHVLAHLMKFVDGDIFNTIKTLMPTNQEYILIQILRHLNLFQPIPQQFLQLATFEHLLVLAMKLYLNGHYYHAYIHYINQLATKLLVADHRFSPITIELFFALSSVHELKDLSYLTAKLTNLFLKKNALRGYTDFWHINMARMSQDIYLADTTNECHVVKMLTANKKKLNCFEYFLIHYQGESKNISTLLYEYLAYYAQQRKTLLRDYAVHHISFLLLRQEISTETKEAIYSTFLHFPELCDDFVHYRLFRFAPQRSIQHYGFQGGIENYQKTIALCNLMLTKLDPNRQQDLIGIAKHAKAEAKQELLFSQQHGFFASIIKYFIRCKIYGWSGFFSPNSPSYVIAEPALKKRLNMPFINVLPKPKDLPTLLLEMNKQELSREQFKELFEALNQYSVKNYICNEYETRLKLHQLFYSVLENEKKYQILHSWLMKNQAPVLRNQTRLLELSLQERSLDETKNLLEQCHLNTEQTRRVAEELNCFLPKQGKFTSSKASTGEEINLHFSPTLPPSIASYTGCVFNWPGISLLGSIFTPKELDGQTPTGNKLPPPGI
jgi:hypothetical protein